MIEQIRELEPEAEVRDGFTVNLYSVDIISQNGRRSGKRTGLCSGV